MFFDIVPLDINRFDNTSKNIVINYGGSMYRKPVVFAFNPLGVSSSRSMNYTFNMSFFVWKGWLNQKETQERLENISSAATSTTSAKAFRFYNRFEFIKSKSNRKSK